MAADVSLSEVSVDSGEDHSPLYHCSDLILPSYMVKIKVKLSLCLTKHHAIETYGGSGRTVPHILNLGDRWR
jgi:hypothetical protein